MRTYYVPPSAPKPQLVRSTVDLRSKDLQAYHVVSEYLTARIEARQTYADGIWHANPDLQPYFRFVNDRYKEFGANATL